MPATIHALLAARIDRLEPEERGVLQRAAVEGRLFHRGAVAELLPDGRDRRAGRHAARARAEGVGPPRPLALRRRRRLSVQPRADPGRRVRVDAEGASRRPPRAPRLLARGRRDAHVAGGDEIVGYHLEQAYVAPRRARAGRRRGARRRAERRATARARRPARARSGRGAAAAALLDRACRLLEVDPRERAALLPDLGRALRGNGALDAADEALAEAIDDARRHRRRADRAPGGDRARPARLHARADRARRCPRRSRGARSPSSSRSAATRTSPTPGS